MINKYTIQSDIVLLEVSSEKHSATAKFDVDDLSKVREHSPWRILTGRGPKYIISTSGELLHHVVLFPKIARRISFKNGDTFDCRKSNLSIPEKIVKTKPIPFQRDSGERWIYPRQGKWFVCICLGGKKYPGGTYESIGNAKIARDNLYRHLKMETGDFE